MEKLQTNEIFALPIGLKPVVKLDSEILYGGESLNRSFIKALNKSSRTNKISSHFEKMIKDKLIVPCFLHKGFLTFLAWKVFAPSGVRNIMGFYYPKTKKVYILLSNDLNIFGYTSNNFLAKLTVHECVHMFANKNKSKFISTFDSNLIPFYKTFLCKIFNINIKDLSNNEVKKIITFIFNKFESKTSKYDNSLLIEYYDILNNLEKISNLKEDQFNLILLDYISLIKTFLKDIKIFFNSIHKYRYIIDAIEYSYKEVFNCKNMNTICIQELIYPSEVIAIYSEFKKDPKIYSAIKQI